MTANLIRRFAQAALIACLALPAVCLLPAGTPLAISNAHAAVPVPSDKPDTANLAEFKRVLSEYGAFATHPRYGEIWVPNVTPPGWHPYPACQWVYTKDGWYFNDETPWGSIVHHYGRWSHDEKVGWFWVPDEDWSPGWVVWRKNDRWVGWAPMPPEQDSHLIASREFNNDKFWTFMEAKKFFSGGCGTTVRATQVIHQTKHVTIFNLPPGLPGPRSSVEACQAARPCYPGRAEARQAARLHRQAEHLDRFTNATARHRRDARKAP